MTYQPKSSYLFTPVFNTEEMQEAMESFSPVWLEKHKTVEGFVLYHYTTLSGLKGILKERALRFGHISTFNDPLEIQHGQKIITDILKDFIEKEESKNVKIFLNQLLVQVQAFGKNLFHAFVVCFCESGDLLSQWRAYAERGGGYCLGFQFSATTKISCNIERPDDRKFPFLRKVIYNKTEQEDLIKQYLEIVVDGSKKAFKIKKYPYEPPEHAVVMAMQAANVLLDMLTSFKHDAFKEEKEWRLIRVTREDFQPESLQFREDGGELIPFRTTYIFDEKENEKLEFPLNSIIFGPWLEPVRTRSAIALLLKHIAADSNTIKLEPTINIKGSSYKLR